MKAVSRLYLLVFTALLLLLNIASADIDVLKKTDKEMYNTGEELIQIIEILNNHEEDITVQIKDSVVIDNRGIIVRCYEAVVPRGEKRTVEYGSIKVYNSGSFTIESAEISYDTKEGKKIIHTNSIDIIVEGENINNVQEIKEIYKCGGVQSTSSKIVSGGGSFSFSIGGGSQGRIINERDDSDKTSIEKDLILTITKTDEYKLIEEKLLSEGFIIQERKINGTEDYADFIFIFRSGDNEKYLVGSIINKTVSELQIINQKKDFSIIILFLLVLIGIIIIVMLYLKSIKVEDEDKDNNPKDNNPKDNNPKDNNPKDNIPKDNNPEYNNPEYNNPNSNSKNSFIIRYDSLKIGDLSLEQIQRETREFIKKEAGILEDIELTNKQAIDKASGTGYEEIARKIFEICERGAYAKDSNDLDSAKNLFKTMIKKKKDLFEKHKKARINMNIIFSFALFIIVFFVLIIPFSYSIEITKSTDKKEYNVGEEIKVSYHINNNNDQPVDFILIDKSSFEGYGFEISCLRLQDVIQPNQRNFVLAGLPARQEIVISNTDLGIEFLAKEAGTYILEPARLIYKDSRLGLIEEVESSSVEIKIIGENKDYEKNIKPYSFCSEESKEQKNNQEQQKEDQPSREEREKEVEEQERRQEQQQQKMQESYNQMSDQDKKLSHSQQNMNQDSNALKQSMEKDRQRREQMQKEFSENVQKNEDVQKMIDEMQKEGFEVTNQSMNARTNTSGDFSVQMENKETGEKTEIKGTLEENKTQNLMNTKDLMQDKGLQELQKSLEEMGFKPHEPEMQADRFNQDFQNPKTGETAQIRGDIEDGKLENAQASFESRQMLEKIMNNEHPYNRELAEAVQKKINQTDLSSSFRMQQVAGGQPEISGMGNNSILKTSVPFNATTGELLKRPDFTTKSLWFTVYFIILLVILAILGYYILTKRKHNSKKIEIKKDSIEYKKKIDYLKVSQEMLAEAQEMYTRGERKDAYGKAAHAVRFYFSYHLKEYKEFSNMNTLKLLRRHGHDIKKVQDCFNLCTLVEFAKYEANDKDFKQIIFIAKGLLQ